MMNTKARILFKENKLILETNESINGERAVVSIIEQRKDTREGKPNNTPNQEEAPPDEGGRNVSWGIPVADTLHNMIQKSPWSS